MPSLTPEEERWGEALMVHRVHGDAAREHVMERIIALTVDRDEAGVARWHEIGDRVEKLLRPGSVQ
jgi:hypothetical protein